MQLTRSDICTLARLIETPNFRGILTVDRALDALLSSTQICSLLAEFNMKLKDDETDERFEQISEALTVALQNTSMITQFLLNEQDANVGGRRMSSSVSIHSFNESTAIEGPSNTEDISRPDSRNSETNPINATVDESESDGINEPPVYNLDEQNIQQEIFRFLKSIFFSIKFIFLLVLNLITILISIKVMFHSIAYITTGNLYFEFIVEKSAETWWDKAKTLAFGPQTEVVRIKSFVELFKRQNLINILEYFADTVRGYNRTL